MKQSKSIKGIISLYLPVEMIYDLEEYAKTKQQSKSNIMRQLIIDSGISISREGDPPVRPRYSSPNDRSESIAQHNQEVRDLKRKKFDDWINGISSKEKGDDIDGEEKGNEAEPAEQSDFSN